MRRRRGRRFAVRVMGASWPDRSATPSRDRLRDRAGDRDRACCRGHARAIRRAARSGVAALFLAPLGTGRVCVAADADRRLVDRGLHHLRGNARSRRGKGGDSTRRPRPDRPARVHRGPGPWNRRLLRRPFRQVHDDRSDRHLGPQPRAAGDLGSTRARTRRRRGSPAPRGGDGVRMRRPPRPLPGRGSALGAAGALERGRPDPHPGCERVRSVRQRQRVRVRRCRDRIG